MKYLSGQDAMFCYMETPEQHQHTLSIVIIDPSTAPGKFQPEHIEKLFDSRLDQFAFFRRRIVKAPFSIGPPALADDPGFNLHQHFHYLSLKAPGSIKTLASKIDKIASTPIADDGHPPWRIWVIDGLANGLVAVVTKTHHSLMDGVGGIQLQKAIYDHSALEIDELAPASRYYPRPIPPESSLALCAARRWFKQRPGIVKTLKKIQRHNHNRSQAVQQNLAKGEKPPPANEKTPRLKFNRALTPNRVIAFNHVSMKSVKQIKQAYGVTVNDVVLTACCLALKDYLISRNDLPQQFLKCCVPVSLRLNNKNKEDSHQQNQVAALNIMLPVQWHDPEEIIRHIHQQTTEAKRLFSASHYGDIMADMVDSLHPALISTIAAQMSKRKLADKIPPSQNLVISNLPGSPAPLYLAGAKVLHNYACGPIVEGQGMNITAMSQCDSLGICIQACPETAPDTWSLADGFCSAIDRLHSNSLALEQ